MTHRINKLKVEAEAFAPQTAEEKRMLDESRELAQKERGFQRWLGSETCARLLQALPYHNAPSTSSSGPGPCPCPHVHAHMRR